MKRTKNKIDSKRYVVGYMNENGCVYGPESRNDHGSVSATHIKRMNLNAARKILDMLYNTNADRAIYELVPVHVIKGNPDAPNRPAPTNKRKGSRGTRGVGKGQRGTQRGNRQDHGRAARVEGQVSGRGTGGNPRSKADRSKQ